MASCDGAVGRGVVSVSCPKVLDAFWVYFGADLRSRFLLKDANEEARGSRLKQ